MGTSKNSEFAHDGIHGGRMRFNQMLSIKRSEAAGGITLDRVTYEQYPEAKKLPLPKDSLICTVKDAGCIEKMFKGGGNIDRLVQNNATLISRYNNFNSLDQYNTQTKAHLSEPFPSYIYYNGK